MKKLERLNFDTHAQIKNIIGQDMINDDNIAVKELVKNSIDANATLVTVSFINTNEKSEDAEILVHDNGRGMSLNDIEQKWLNMAYSSKKFDNNRLYAGNKGIGRFSADRLGQTLHLYTKQKKENKIIKIVVDWERFENKLNWEDRIRDVKFRGYLISKKEFRDEVGIKSFSNGTILKILRPRYVWSESKLKRLKKDLEKFMIPNQVEGGDEFELFLDTKGYGEEGANISGRIENQVFDKLPFKTSFIKSSIDEKGGGITTELYHRGELLIQLNETNNFKELNNAAIILFYLNPYNKAFFKRQTGTPSVDYGSVFLYLNGFRVPPYGEQDNDWLGVDRRHGQGHSRHLGLRDLLGRIELKDRLGTTYEITSDREGIKKNDAFLQLQDVADGYFGHVLKKLETFVVDGLSWDSASEKYTQIVKRIEEVTSDFDSVETHYKKSDEEKEKQLVSQLDSIILRGTNSEDVKSIKLGPRALEILGRQHDEDLKKLQEKLTKFEGKIEVGNKNLNFKNLLNTIRKSQTHIKSLQLQVDTLKKDEAETTKKLKASEKSRLFAEAHMTSDEEKMKEIIHLTGNWGEQIEAILEEVLVSLHDPAPDHSIDQLVSEVESAKMLSAKLTKLSRIISKANFALMSDETSLDIFSYIDQYVAEINEFGPYITKLKTKYSNPKNASKILNMSALEVSMLIDNLILNAERSKAENLNITVSQSKSGMKVAFEDNGNGLTDEFSPNMLFEPGVTTTKGSGMGLFQVKKIADNLEASVSIRNNSRKGATVVLEWVK